ncbi:hypothetical protein Syun_003731 [Stephania yunnanensis]|uniref:Uncharacterized protein n=1 Tax=Stephania yunnanensis TaxID=152371 RepID=A0AAP0L482_9MAGN
MELDSDLLGFLSKLFCNLIAYEPQNPTKWYREPSSSIPLNSLHVFFDIYMIYD